jgi:hypothetical protein
MPTGPFGPEKQKRRSRGFSFFMGQGKDQKLMPTLAIRAQFSKPTLLRSLVFR